MSGFILALDQGTTNAKALAIDGQGRIAVRHSAPTPVRYPRPGWVEQSGAEIWSATAEALEGCLAALPAEARLAAISVVNQRESVLLRRRSTSFNRGSMRRAARPRRESGNAQYARRSTARRADPPPRSAAGARLTGGAIC